MVKKRIRESIEWPGYFNNINSYSKLPDDVTSDIAEDALPSSIHMHDVSVFRRAMEKHGFIIKFCDYLNGKENGAVPETWNDGREYVGVIAAKP